MTTIATYPSTGQSVRAVDAPHKTTELLDNVAKGAHETIDFLSDTAAPLAQQLHEGVDRASETVIAGAEQVDALQQMWLDRARKKVHAHPLLSLGAAVAAGLLISRMARRRA